MTPTSLKRRRLAAKLSQRELAELACVDTYTISKFERGVTKNFHCLTEESIERVLKRRCV